MLGGNILGDLVTGNSPPHYLWSWQICFPLPLPPITAVFAVAFAPLMRQRPGSLGVGGPPLEAACLAWRLRGPRWGGRAAADCRVRQRRRLAEGIASPLRLRPSGRGSSFARSPLLPPRATATRGDVPPRSSAHLHGRPRRRGPRLAPRSCGPGREARARGRPRALPFLLPTPRAPPQPLLRTLRCPALSGQLSCTLGEEVRAAPPQSPRPAERERRRCRSFGAAISAFRVG